MLQLLNKLAWGISLIWWFIFIMIFWILTDSFSDPDFFGVVLFLWLLVSCFIKWIFFSRSYISSRLHFFKDRLWVSSWETEQAEAKPLISHSDTLSEDMPHMAEDMQEFDAFEKTDFDSTPLQAPEPVIQTPSEPWFIAKFFSENLLAKVGGILVFLWVLFFLSIVYSWVGPMAKLIIWFMVGFWFFFTGVWMDKKWFEDESRIVMWVGILINYLVILWARYLLGDDTSTGASFFSVAATFIFLIMNTIFAVAVSLFYQSRPLLIFAFVFAYLNPFLLWSSSSEPYTLLGYTMIVTLWAMYVSYREKDEILFPLAFIFPAFIFLVAPWSDWTGWITKLLCINILWAISLYVSTYFKKSYSFIFEILIAGTFFLLGFMWILWIENLSALQLGIMWVSSLWLMWFCYAFMNRGVYLYSLGTIWTILTMTPVILANGFRPDTVLICSVLLLVFAVMNIWIIALRNKDILSDNLDNVVSGLVSWVLFITYMIYAYGNKYFEDIGQWITFFGLGIVYAGLTYFLVNKITLEKVKANKKYQNLCYTTAAIALSLWSLAIAFLFADSKEAISVIWLLEATILFFVTQKLKSLKVAIWALILFVIGILRFPPLIDNLVFYKDTLTGNYGMLVVWVIVLLSLIANLYILSKERESSKLYFSKEIIAVHNFFHVIGMITLSIMTYEIFDISWSWNSLLYFSVILSLLGLLYERLGSKSLQFIHLLTYFGFLFIHILVFLDHLNQDSMNILISTLIVVIFALPYLYNYLTKQTIWSRSLFTLFVLYLFIISTLYIQHFFDTTFAITIYWWVLAFALLSFGISKNILYARTIWLYIITLTAGKIFLYDIWVWTNNIISRVVALMIVWILMIVISTMYTRKYGSRINDEFSLSNLFPDITFSDIENKSHQKDSEQDKTTTEINTQIEQENSMMKDIESVDVSAIKSVKIQIHWNDKVVRVRSKKLTQIIKIVTDTTGRQSFSAGELSDTYHSITSNYKSDLPAAQYTRIKSIMKDFVDHGGSVEFVSE